MTYKEFVNWITLSLIDIKAVSTLPQRGRGAMRRKIVAANRPMSMRALDFFYVARRATNQVTNITKYGA